MELEAGRRCNKPGGVTTMAGIPYVFTIGRVAEILGEDEGWLHQLSMGLDPEDGCLWVLDVGDREVQAFTEYGIECLRELIADQRADGSAPPPKPKPQAPAALTGGIRYSRHRSCDAIG